VSISPPVSQGRQSSLSIPTQGHLLRLADPSPPPEISSAASWRTQKPPATFQCSVCPKLFSRAYSLRSHLQIHTDELPFVCSICGKAFARQHDQKRHEGLHSGEKMFVCRESLKNGSDWDCLSRFARADALGRYFRTEADCACIKPLLEVEAIGRLQSPQSFRMARYRLSAVLLQRHPLLGGIWGPLPSMKETIVILET
jgi:transcription factor CRZ1